MPSPIRTRRVATAQAEAAGVSPRWNGFSANHSEVKAWASAVSAMAMQARGLRSPCARTPSSGNSLMVPRGGSHAARARRGARLGKMHVHDPPIAVLLAEHHRRAGDVLGAVTPCRGRRLAADPVRSGLAMAPQDREVVGHDPADVERGPVAARDVLFIELPQPGPVLAALIGMTVEVEEHR